MSLARAFEEIFSLCAKYPKVCAKVFSQWMIDNHSSDLLFHVERAASGGRQDATSMSAIAIFWNINYFVEFLDEMIIYCSKSENILVRNLMILLSFIDIIAVSQIWLILHISIFTPMCCLSECTQKMKEYICGYIPMGK